MKLRLFFCLLVVFIFSAAFSTLKSFAGTKNNGKNSSKTDTLQARVMYGEDFLFPSFDVFSKKQIAEYRDSIAKTVSVPKSYVNQVDLYLRILAMDNPQIVHLIDSLFDTDNISYPLINQINLYIAKRQTESINNLEICKEEKESKSKYPADEYYHSWDTKNPNPYTKKLTIEDSIYYLQLNPVDSLNSFFMPRVGIKTSSFGWRYGRNHNGVDIALNTWDPVVAAFPGMVRFAKTYGGYGRVVVIRHYNGLETTYAHLQRVKVKPGQLVKAGDLIGLGGSTGHSTGSHLHFECRFKGYPINPENFISLKEKKLITKVLVMKKTKFGFAAFPIGAEFYVVKKGDYLQKIAQNYGTTTKKLCEINHIKRNKMLIIGDKIRII